MSTYSKGISKDDCIAAIAAKEMPLGAAALRAAALMIAADAAIKARSSLTNNIFMYNTRTCVYY